MGKKGMLEKFWGMTAALMGSVWAYFQPVHHLIQTISFIILINFVAEAVKDYKRYRVRKTRKRRFSICRWFYTVNFSKMLLEPAIGVFVVMCLCVIYKLLSVEEEATIYLDVAKWFTYIITVAYLLALLVRLEELFPDFFISKIISFIYDKLLKLFTSQTKLTDEEKEELEDLVKGVDKSSVDKS